MYILIKQVFIVLLKFSGSLAKKVIPDENNEELGH